MNVFGIHMVMSLICTLAAVFVLSSTSASCSCPGCGWLYGWQSIRSMSPLLYGVVFLFFMILVGM